MEYNDHLEKAKTYVETLYAVEPNRRTGSPGNRAATAFIANIIKVATSRRGATLIDNDYIG